MARRTHQRPDRNLRPIADRWPGVPLRGPMTSTISPATASTSATSARRSTDRRFAARSSPRAVMTTAPGTSIQEAVGSRRMSGGGGWFQGGGLHRGPGTADSRSKIPPCAHLPSRSRNRRRRRQRTPSPGRRARADRVRELRQPRHPRSAGLGAHQQVRRGLSGQALLRRLRVRGRGRVAGDRARQGAVRRRPRQRAAALGRAGQPGGVLRGGEAGRHRARHEPGPRRPPDARPPAELLRPALQDRPLRRAAGRRAHRLRGAGAAGARAHAEDDRRRRQRLPAHHRLRAHRARGRRPSAPS